MKYDIPAKIISSNIETCQSYYEDILQGHGAGITQSFKSLEWFIGEHPYLKNFVVCEYNPKKKYREMVYFNHDLIKELKQDVLIEATSTDNRVVYTILADDGSSAFTEGKGKFNDGINYDFPPRGGLYFIGETHFNPFTGEAYYCVKIGKAKDFKTRLAAYKCCNPMAYYIDMKPFGEVFSEETYHVLLKHECIATCSHAKEWFFVTRETYLKMCEKGFSYFR